MGLFSKRQPVNVGGRFFGVYTRADGRARPNFINNPATGQDRKLVAAVKKKPKKN
jgi:hypothetical protein